MNFVDYLKSLVKKSNLKEVINSLTSLFTACNPDKETDAILLSSDFNRLRTEKNEGIIATESYNTRFSLLVKRSLELIDEVSANLETYSRFIDPKTHEILESRKNGKKTILFLAANPEDASIDLSGELESISNKLVLTDKRKEFEFRAKTNLRKKDFQRAILELTDEPKFIHFAGSSAYKDENYGTGLKLCGNDFASVAILDPPLLEKILLKFDSIECLFFNACNTTPLSVNLSKKIPFIVSMDHFVTDRLAISFATSFYEAIGAGKDIKFAFNYSLDNLRLEDSFTDLELNTPRLIERNVKIDYQWHGQTYEEWKKIVYPEGN